MADLKVSQLTEIPELQLTDWLYIVDDPGGTPGSYAIQVGNLASSDPGAASALLKTNASGFVTLQALLVDEISGLTGPADLTLIPGGNLHLSPSGNVIVDATGNLELQTHIALDSANQIGTDNFVSDTTGWRVTYAGIADFRTLLANGATVSGRLRTTALGSDPASGEGIELFYDPTIHYGHILAYDRTAVAYEELRISGNPLVLRNQSNTIMHVTNSGVGMSTSTPRGMLEISSGDLVLSNKSQWFGLPMFEGSSGWARGIYFFDNDESLDASTVEAGFGILGSQDTWSRMWWTMGGDPWNSVEGIVLYNNAGAARVAIGTNGPNFRFEVREDVDTYVSRIWNTGLDANAHVLTLYGGEASNPTNYFVRMFDGDGTAVGHIVGNGAGGVTYGSVSDKRRKQDIETLVGALDKVLALTPITYRGLGQTTATPKTSGLVAQQVRPIMPELVAEDAEGVLSLNYAGVVPYLIGAIQALHKRIEALEA